MFQEKERSNFQRFWWQRLRSRTYRKEVLQIPWYVKTYDRSMHYTQGTGQVDKTEQYQTIWQKAKVHQAWGKCYGTEASQESSETEKMKCTEKLCAFKKMSVSDSGQESIQSSSSKKDEIWKLGSGKLFNFNHNHIRKKLTTQKNFLNLNNCVNVYYNYEYLRSCIVSHTNSRKTYKIFVFSTQEDLVPITFGEWIPKDEICHRQV